MRSLPYSGENEMIEATYIVTKSQLADAFTRWEEQYTADPEAFESCTGEDFAQRSADYLIKLIKGEA
jgi:hypothetical protein